MIQLIWEWLVNELYENQIKFSLPYHLICCRHFILDKNNEFFKEIQVENIFMTKRKICKLRKSF